MQIVQNKKFNSLIICFGLFFLILGLPDKFFASEKVQTILAIGALMFSLWVTETFPIAITSLIPILLFPVMDVMDINKTASYYGSKIIFLFLSGFILALALEKWHLNKRIALNILKLTGNGPRNILLGFMLATALLSMWISNTATTVMMLPIALSMIYAIDDNPDPNFSKTLMIAIAYAASIGGIATIIGTPPNAILVNYLSESQNYDISFFFWFVRFLPLTIIVLMGVWAFLAFFKLKNTAMPTSKTTEVIDKELKKLGAMSYEEKLVMSIFAFTALSWIFKGLLPFKIDDVAIGIFGAALMFIVPCKNSDDYLLNWGDTKNLSWGTLLLFGGGFALAKGMENSGFIDIIGNYIEHISQGKLIIALLVSIFIAIFLTEFMSNLALTAIIVPVLAAISITYTGNPLALSMPAAVATSCAFMTPMATPPNAIVFSSGFIKMKDMIKTGIFCNLFSFVTIFIYAKLVIN